jgi:hypothetical protein
MTTPGMLPVYTGSGNVNKTEKTEKNRQLLLLGLWGDLALSCNPSYLGGQSSGMA